MWRTKPLDAECANQDRGAIIFPERIWTYPEYAVGCVLEILRSGCGSANNDGFIISRIHMNNISDISIIKLKEF
jgi:hypothetical protein